VARKIITLSEAGRRLRPDRPLTPQRVRQLVAEAGFQLVPFKHPTDRRIRTGIAVQTLAALKRRRRSA
jgi:hypothetical protein